MSTRRDDSWVGAAFLLLAGFLMLGVWQFSKLFGLDMATGFSVIFRLLVLATLCGISLYFWTTGTWDRFGINNTWPILVGLFWVCLWPALNYNAMNSVPSFMNPDSVSIWWGTWYGQWGGLVVIIGIGYLSKAIIKAIWPD